MRRQPKTKEEAVLHIRGDLRALGVDVDALSDKEIERAVARMAEAATKFGVSMQQASDHIAKAMNETSRRINHAWPWGTLTSGR